MIHRRGFLASLAALVCAPFVPAVKAPTTQSLMFHPDAFALAMQPITRLDVLYGFGVLNPSFSCRVICDETSWKPKGSFQNYLAADAAIQESLHGC